MEEPITINLAITLTDKTDPVIKLAFLELASTLRELRSELTMEEEPARFIDEDDAVTQETILEYLKARGESDPRGMRKLADNSMGNLLHRISKKRLRRACIRCGKSAELCRCPGHWVRTIQGGYHRRFDSTPRGWEVSKSDLLALTADDLERVHYQVRPRTAAFIEWLRESEQVA